METPLPDEVIGEALRKALRGYFQQAREGVLKYPERPEDSAHHIRTRAKRLQALCRLIPKKRRWRRKFLPIISELKDVFAGSRDEVIVAGLLDRFGLEWGEELPACEAPNLRQAQRLLDAGIEALEAEVAWEEITWAGVIKRAKKSFRLARSGWMEVRVGKVSDLDFHEWRKRMKSMFYQCEFLSGFSKIAKFSKQVEMLAEVLGKFQDLAVTEDWMVKRGGLDVPRELLREKDALRRIARRRGAILFKVGAKDFQNLLTQR